MCISMDRIASACDEGFFSMLLCYVSLHLYAVFNVVRVRRVCVCVMLNEMLICFVGGGLEGGPLWGPK